MKPVASGRESQEELATNEPYGSVPRYAVTTTTTTLNVPCFRLCTPRYITPDYTVATTDKQHDPSAPLDVIDHTCLGSGCDRGRFCISPVQRIVRGQK